MLSSRAGSRDMQLDQFAAEAGKIVELVGIGVLVAGAILAVGAFVLSQNHQSHGLPVGIVVAFLLYNEIRARFGTAGPVAPGDSSGVLNGSGVTSMR